MSERIRGSYDDALYKSTFTYLTLLTLTDEGPPAGSGTLSPWMYCCHGRNTTVYNSHRTVTRLDSTGQFPRHR